MRPEEGYEVARYHDLSPGDVVRSPYDDDKHEIASVEFEGVATVNVSCSDDHTLTGHIHQKILRRL